MEIGTRTDYMIRNFFWSTVGLVVSTLLNFVSRTIFINTLGTVYLGINGLLSNILGMLSFAELGIGSAISFSLYKPLAEKDTEKIKGIIFFYKKAYRMVALVVAVIGLSIMPFLKIIAKGAEDIDHIYLIYLIYLFNIVTSYLITYKTTILNADQQEYIVTNIKTIINIIVISLQTVVLILYKNFLLYLIVNAVVQLIGRVYLNLFTNKRYPYLEEKNIVRLTVEEKNTLYTKIKSLIMHKIGEISIYQTDNIITSSFINVKTVGLVSNFTLIINTVNMLISSFFGAATAGLGNVIATENTKRRKEIYNKYDFLAFWFFGVSSVGLFFLLEPFVTLWIGEDKLVDKLTIALLCINYYLTGMRVPMGNIRTAGGVFEPDKWSPIVQSVINIAVSVAGAIYLGLPGIYIGTLISSMIPNIVRPYIVYKYIFDEKCGEYFKEYTKRIGSLIILVVILRFLFEIMYIKNLYLEIVVRAIICFFCSNLFFIWIYRKSDELMYVLNKLKSIKNKWRI